MQGLRLTCSWLVGNEGLGKHGDYYVGSSRVQVVGHGQETRMYIIIGYYIMLLLLLKKMTTA